MKLTGLLYNRASMSDAAMLLILGKVEQSSPGQALTFPIVRKTYTGDEGGTLIIERLRVSEPVPAKTRVTIIDNDLDVVADDFIGDEFPRVARPRGRAKRPK